MTEPNNLEKTLEEAIKGLLNIAEENILLVVKEALKAQDKQTEERCVKEMVELLKKEVWHISVEPEPFVSQEGAIKTHNLVIIKLISLITKQTMKEKCICKCGKDIMENEKVAIIDEGEPTEEHLCLECAESIQGSSTE